MFSNLSLFWILLSWFMSSALVEWLGRLLPWKQVCSMPLYCSCIVQLCQCAFNVLQCQHHCVKYLEIHLNFKLIWEKCEIKLELSSAVLVSNTWHTSREVTICLQETVLYVRQLWRPQWLYPFTPRCSPVFRLKCRKAECWVKVCFNGDLSNCCSFSICN